MFIRTLAQKIKGFVCKPILSSVISGLIVALPFGYMGYILIHTWGQMASYEWRIDYCQIAWAFIYYSLSLALALLGWGLAISRLTGIRDPRKHIKYYIYTNLLRRLPAPLLYLFGRVYLYEREGIARSAIMTISLLEWILIVLSGIIVYLLTMPFLPSPLNLHSPWFLLLILIVIASTLLLHPRVIRAILCLLGKRELVFSFGYIEILVWLVVYSLVWIGGGLMLYAAINSLYTLPLARLPTVIGAWVISGLVTTVVFATSAGFGLKEFTLSFLLSHLMPSPLAIIVALLTRVYLVSFEFFWGMVALKL